MKHISILVPTGSCILSSIVGSYKIFNSVNSYMKMINPNSNDFFEIDLVGINKQTNLYNGAFQVNPNKTIDEVKKTDLIVVSTIMGDFDQELKNNAAFIPWIKEQRLKNNAEIASLCTGAFLLAETGLLDGKTCATHWIAHEAFKNKYPQVLLAPEKIICEDNGIYSSGGAYSFLNLLLHLVDKYVGREAAIWASKLFEIDFDRIDQSQFIIFVGQKEHADQAIKESQTYIEKNYNSKISVEDLASMAAISRRNFVRRFKKATSNTPLEYIQRVKIEAAKKTLESSMKNVKEVMYTVGYSDDKAFRNTFKKFTGLTPLKYRKKYNREMAS